MKYNLFLDDERFPQQVHWIKLPLPSAEYVIVRNFDQFVTMIENNGLPEHLSLDHDLAFSHYAALDEFSDPKVYDEFAAANEKTGYHCLKWLIDYCAAKGDLPLPKLTYHTLNSVGKVNMKALAESYDRYRESL